MLKYLIGSEKRKITINDKPVMLTGLFIDTFLVTSHMMAPELFNSNGDLLSFTLESYGVGLNPPVIFKILLDPMFKEDGDHNYSNHAIAMMIEFYHVYMIDDSKVFADRVKYYLYYMTPVTLIDHAIQLFSGFNVSGKGFKYSQKVMATLMKYFRETYPLLKFAILDGQKTNEPRVIYFGKTESNNMLYAITGGQPVNLYEIVKDDIYEILSASINSSLVIDIICEHYFSLDYSEVKY